MREYHAISAPTAGQRRDIGLLEGSSANADGRSLRLVVIFRGQHVIDFDGQVIRAGRLQALHAVVADLARIQVASVALAAFDAFARLVEHAHFSFLFRHDCLAPLAHRFAIHFQG